MFKKLMEKFNGNDLKKRSLSSLALAPFVLFLVYCGGLPFAIGLMVAMSLGLREWWRLVGPSMPPDVNVFALVSLLVVLAAGTFGTPGLGVAFCVTAMGALYLVAMRHNKQQAVWMACGLPYLAGSGLAMLYLREQTPRGAFLMFYVFAVVWATDIGAYVAGRSIGGPKLLPSISPKKTWAGLWGGIASATLAGYVVAMELGAQYPTRAALCGAFLALISQAGDFFESFVKRRSGVKDSGELIPGHGGMLDRIDGLLFAVVFLALVEWVARDFVNWW